MAALLFLCATMIRREPWMQNMPSIFFHCANEEHEFAARRGVAIDNLVEACEHAHRIVRSYVMTAGEEDWRGWVLYATDELGEEIFTVPFASVLGKLH
jgi:hypothetical protein